MSTLTVNYRMVLPDYNSTGWHTAVDNNFTIIDTLLGKFAVGLNLQSIWLPSTLYEAGVSIIDGATGHIWVCSVTHTSLALPNEFANELVAYPTYWTDITSPALTASAYAVAAAASASDAADALVQIGLVSSFRNRLINGALEINERAASSYVTLSGAEAYTFDRWYMRSDGYTATCTVTAGTAYGSKQYAAITGAVPVAGIIYFGQRIEAVNCYDLLGKQVTASFYMSASVSAGAMAFSASIIYTTVTDSWSAPTTFAQSITITPTATPTLYTVTFNALPIGVDKGMALVIIGVQSGALGNLNLKIGTISLEVGELASTFERRPYHVELAACQRYYERIAYATGVTIGCATVSTNPTPPIAGGLQIPWKVPKRINAITTSSPANTFAVIGIVGLAIAVAGDKNGVIIVSLSTASGSTGANYTSAYIGATPGAYFEGNAELQ